MEIEKVTRQIIDDARELGTSDIHILPTDDEYQIFNRLNGQLVISQSLSFDDGLRLLNYLKYLSHLDVGEKRRPQTGSLTLKTESYHQDLRLSTIADYSGRESLVIRLLSEERETDLLKSCFFKYEVGQMQRLMRFQSGLILFSGPVNSGKTTTMYNLIRERLDAQALQVISIEDPVEIHERRFLQAQVNHKSQVTYESLLKASLRHHPDIILVGEIRDEETAQMVVRGALTGHLIVASVHAKNAVGVLARLSELGISEELLRQTIIGIIFQKLLPIYCPLCAGQCHPQCNHHPLTQKRLALYEVLQTEEIISACRSEYWGQSLHEREFNHLLEKVYSYGFISEETFDYYYIP